MDEPREGPGSGFQSARYREVKGMRYRLCVLGKGSDVEEQREPKRGGRGPGG